MQDQVTTLTPSDNAPNLSELWQTAWALQGVTRTLDIEHGDAEDLPFERDRLHGLASAAHLLSTHMLRIADAFNEAMYSRHDDMLARIAGETGETPLEVAARLLCEALEADTARREGGQ